MSKDDEKRQIRKVLADFLKGMAAQGKNKDDILYEVNQITKEVEAEHPEEGTGKYMGKDFQMHREGESLSQENTCPICNRFKLATDAFCGGTYCSNAS